MLTEVGNTLLNFLNTNESHQSSNYYLCEQKKEHEALKTDYVFKKITIKDNLFQQFEVYKNSCKTAYKTVKLLKKLTWVDSELAQNIFFKLFEYNYFKNIIQKNKNFSNKLVKLAIALFGSFNNQLGALPDLKNIVVQQISEQNEQTHQTIKKIIAYFEAYHLLLSDITPSSNDLENIINFAERARELNQNDLNIFSEVCSAIITTKNFSSDCQKEMKEWVNQSNENIVQKINILSEYLQIGAQELLQIQPTKRPKLNSMIE